MTKRTHLNSATTPLIDRITAVIRRGKGAAKLIEAEKKAPAQFSRDDGVRFDPEWQDDFIGK